MSEKVVIVTDSNSGITQAEAKKLGVVVLPMPFLINGETLFEDISLDQDGFYQRLQQDVDISTSQPTPSDVTGLWDSLLQEYDSVVHIPMSSGLSGSCATALALAEDYDGRVQVVNNQRISVTQRQSTMDAVALAKAGKTAAQIKEILEIEKFNSSIYIMVDTMKYLKKGGRVTPAAATIATVLRIKPVLQIQGEKLDAFAKARSVEHAKTLMLNAIKKDIAERFGGDHNAMHLEIAYTYDLAAAEAFKVQVLDMFPGHDIIMNPLSLSVSCHIGPGALALACSKKLSL